MPFNIAGYSIMQSKDRFTAIILALLVWGFAGALFGALFAGLHQILLVLGLTGWLPLIVATAAASMTTTAFYSAMPVALVGSMAGVLASIGYLVVIGQDIDLLMIASLAAGAGVVAGAFYSWMVTGSSRPLAETLTGLISGSLAGGVLSLLLWFLDEPVSVFVLAAGVVALAGVFFEIFEHWLVKLGVAWLPGVVSAPLVAGLIAAVVAGSIWILGNTTTTVLDMRTQEVITHVLNDIPPGLLGGVLGGAITGIMLEIFGFRLEEQIEDQM
ncbi:spermidine synthase [Allochromatium palmeri]|uniref:Spermidine synthase n=1 Tax=Allochromatium palmeri TaxID=231048 RepID=A0A6N8EIL2_9GAMM|nr:spermidine synthase [Allochromatium palmeri]